MPQTRKALLPFFPALKEHVRELGRKHNVEVVLEHYVISTGLAEMIRGTSLAAHCDGIYGCEFLEHPLPPHFSKQDELALELPTEITQVAAMVDNTIKTRFLFEINKGSNKNPEIDVNAVVQAEDRRVPFENMIYVADGPSDVPVFSLLRKNGGKAFAVYVPESEAEFAQNDALLQAGRVHGYGPCDYSAASFTPKWIRHALAGMVERVVAVRHVEHARVLQLHRVDAAGDDEVVAHHDRMPCLLGRPPAHPEAPGVVEGEVLRDHAVIRRQVVLGEQVGDHRGLGRLGELRLGRVPVFAAEEGEVATGVPRHVVVGHPVNGHLHMAVHLAGGQRLQLAQQVAAVHLLRQ